LGGWKKATNIQKSNIKDNVAYIKIRYLRIERDSNLGKYTLL